MITLAERRAVRRFADLVDSPDIDTIDVDTAGELAPLLLVARDLQRVPVNGDIDPKFRTKLRARVVAMSAVRLPAQRQTSEPKAPPGPAEAPRWRSGRRRVIVAGGAMACVLSLAGVGVASSQAHVGDPLYGIKRAMESGQLKLAGSDSAKGRRYLTLARTRLGEARQVRGDQSAVVETLAAMDLATRNGSRLLTGVAANEQDRAPLDSIDEFAAAQRTGLASLISGMSAGPGRERAVESLVLVERLHARSVALRATLVCPVAAAPADDLGPRPADCGSGATPGAGPLGPGLNGLPGPAPSGVGATALPGGAAGSGGAGAGATAPSVPPAGSGATGAVSGILDDLLSGLGGNTGATSPTPAPSPLGLPLPLPLPLPSIIPTLPPLLP